MIVGKIVVISSVYILASKCAQPGFPCSKLALRLLLDASVPESHASIAAPVLRSLQLAHHHSAAFWLIPQREQQPQSLLLRAISGSKPSLTKSVKLLKPEDLKELFCSWLDTQLVNICSLLCADYRGRRFAVIGYGAALYWVSPPNKSICFPAKLASVSCHLPEACTSTKV